MNKIRSAFDRGGKRKEELEALEKVAEGPANKVFIPFDATKTLGAISTMVEAKNIK